MTKTTRNLTPHNLLCFLPRILARPKHASFSVFCWLKIAKYFSTDGKRKRSLSWNGKQFPDFFLMNRRYFRQSSFFNFFLFWRILLGHLHRLKFLIFLVWCWSFEPQMEWCLLFERKHWKRNIFFGLLGCYHLEKIETSPAGYKMLSLLPYETWTWTIIFHLQTIVPLLPEARKIAHDVNTGRSVPGDLLNYQSATQKIGLGLPERPRW